MGVLLNSHRDLVQAAGGILGISVLDKSEHLKIKEGVEDGMTVISTDWTNPLLFRDVPLGIKKPKTMTLALSFKASFQEVGGVSAIAKCTVAASYWTPVNQKDATTGVMKTHFRHSHSFHFDYHHFSHTAGKAIHPIFHLQPGSKVVGDKISTFKAPPKDEVANAKNTRVPTPPMDLPAVIEMLFADYFPHVVNQQTMKPWIAARTAIPRLAARPCATHANGRQACCYYDGCLDVLMS